MPQNEGQEPEHCQHNLTIAVAYYAETQASDSMTSALQILSSSLGRLGDEVESSFRDTSWGVVDTAVVAL